MLSACWDREGTARKKAVCWGIQSKVSLASKGPRYHRNSRKDSVLLSEASTCDLDGRVHPVPLQWNTDGAKLGRVR